MIKKRIRYLSFFINIDIRKWNTFIAYFNFEFIPFACPAKVQTDSNDRAYLSEFRDGIAHHN